MSKGDKIYSIEFAGNASARSYLLSDVSRKDFLGVACIRGTIHYPTAPKHWMASRILYAPIEKLLRVTEYDSIDAYKAAVKRHFEAQAKKT